MEHSQTKLKGCYLIELDKLLDDRGCFVKTFNKDFFLKHNMRFDFEEEYYTVSKKNVLRGFHFQLPPHDHAKLVSCIKGSVMDVVVDLRQGSLTFGEFEIIELNSDNPKAVYIPSGMAHGFYTRSNEAIMNYNVTSMYSPSHECGIKWDSINVDWPKKSPILSKRDHLFQSLGDFNSPFII
jgi:dTDP-4-dehydrorhamnose 3,5-epimerase